ncbi:hypothetical protein ABT124_01165 [Streptomyces sp. NPDC001982]|uniref:hypothetical protein n=1 Tax=unclassified Streptomyces TaxID=2593676 RepID=UPI00331A549C
MHLYLVVAGALVVTLMAVFGIAGITTGWVVPFGRHRVLRPKLWGYGQLLGAVGASLWMFLGVFPAKFDVIPLIGWFVFMGGAGVQMLAQRPGRPPRLPPTKSAS